MLYKKNVWYRTRGDLWLSNECVHIHALLALLVLLMVLISLGARDNRDDYQWKPFASVEKAKSISLLKGRDWPAETIAQPPRLCYHNEIGKAECHQLAGSQAS